jgi:hypothetical protein
VNPDGTRHAGDGPAAPRPGDDHRPGGPPNDRIDAPATAEDRLRPRNGPAAPRLLHPTAAEEDQ